MTSFHDKQHSWRKSSSLAELGCLFRKEQSTYYNAAVFAHAPWRHKICDWYYELIDLYNFDREVVAVAMNYFDRYISSQILCEGVHTKEKYQIVAITALFLAIKVHSMSEECLVESRSQVLSQLIYGQVNPQKIYEMERNILQILDWRLNPPTMHQFALNFSQLHPLGYCCSVTKSSYLYEATRYQVELAVFVPDLLTKFKPSVVVFAAMKNAEERIETDCPGILTNEMKQSFERMLMEDPSIIIDPNAVAQCQLLFKRVCPQLPDLGYFGNDPDQVSAPGYNVHEDQVVAHGYNIQ